MPAGAEIFEVSDGTIVQNGSEGTKTMAFKAFDSAVQAATYVDDRWKVKVMLRDGALKTCRYAMELDEKYSISSQTKSIDEQYKISETTSRVASKTKEVLDAVKKRDPTGLVPMAESWFSGTLGIVCKVASMAIEQATLLLRDEEGEVLSESEKAAEKDEDEDPVESQETSWVNDKINSGVVRSYKYAKELDEKYRISSQTKSITEEYGISSTTSRLAAHISSKSQIVLDVVRERDPTGIVPYAEKWMFGALERTLSYVTSVKEQASKLAKEEENQVVELQYNYEGESPEDDEREWLVNQEKVSSLENGVEHCVSQ